MAKIFTTKAKIYLSQRWFPEYHYFFNINNKHDENYCFILEVHTLEFIIMNTFYKFIPKQFQQISVRYPTLFSRAYFPFMSPQHTLCSSHVQLFSNQVDDWYSWNWRKTNSASRAHFTNAAPDAGVFSSSLDFCDFGSSYKGRLYRTIVILDGITLTSLPLSRFSTWVLLDLGNYCCWLKHLTDEEDTVKSRLR